MTLEQGETATTAAAATDEDWLFFGCRHRDKDFLFGEELSAMATPMKLAGAPPKSSGQLNLRVAFSRDERATGALHGADEHNARLYVTHRLREASNAALVWDAVAYRGASIYVAGSAGQMPKDVNAVIKHIAITHGDLDASKAEEFIRKLERRRRFCVEAYG